MKLIYFTILFMVLLASTALARGLEIPEIRFYVSYDDAYAYRLDENLNRDRTSNVFGLTNNSKINADVLPGSNVTFTIRLENMMQGSLDDLRNVFARVRIEEIDDGADLEDTSTEIDLDAGSDGNVDVNFGIPVDVKAGTYKVVIEGEGSGRNHTNYRTEVNLKLEIKKQSHDIRITKYQLNPSVIDCNRKTKIIGSIINAGSNSEEQVALEFKSGELGINSIDRDISLINPDDATVDEKTYTKTLSADIHNSLKAGVYPILVNLYWKNNILFDRKILYLTVRDCNPNAQKPVNNGENGPIDVASQQQPIENSIPSFSSYGYLLIIVFGLLAFITTALVIFMYSRIIK